MHVDEIAESPILSLIDRIFELRQRGEKVLGLHIGEPDFDTPAGIRDAAYRAMNEGFTHYVSAQGMPDLRAAIAERLRSRHRIPASASDVVILPAKYAIYASLLATTGPSDEVLLPDPTYLFEQPVRLTGARPVYFPLGPEFSLDTAALEAAITPRSRVLVLVSPANPTGRLLRRDEVRAAVEIARDHHLTILSDETYESLIYEGTHVAPASLAEGTSDVVTIGSFSKVFSMTGWRAGFAVAPPKIRSRLVKVMEHTLTCLPPFIQMACLWALQNAGPDEVRFREIFRQRRDQLLSRLDGVRGISYVRPQGAFYVFPRFSLQWSSVEFTNRLLEEERLALVPGVSFGPAGERHVRISYSSPVPLLEDGVVRLGRFLERHGAPRGDS
ncbi:MAG TPA: aminotransferase class I/II-fold pyridoxal phosphate-dependent enzyme [Thermoplasmata archaeon]|nr:aminotransferase class I/II-fold pyridoxal phosphate-dependent enzyme [Thermoplasmata archaeon]